MSNVEQGISNDEVELLRLFPSAFFIRYSTFCSSLLNSLAVCDEVAGEDSNQRTRRLLAMCVALAAVLDYRVPTLMI